jgi:hypothetical protein
MSLENGENKTEKGFPRKGFLRREKTERLKNNFLFLLLGSMERKGHFRFLAAQQAVDVRAVADNNKDTEDNA